MSRILPVLFPVFLLLIFCHCFPVEKVLAAPAESALVWQKDGVQVLGRLPKSWRAMTSRELEDFAEMSKKLVQVSGEFVSGFQLITGDNPGDGPYLLVFANQGGRVTKDQMQKTYSWFEKNSRLASTILPSRAQNVDIENIEYIQDRFTILFQIRMEADHHVFTGLSGIIFLANGYLNIIGFARDTAFSSYAESIYSFITTVSVPAPLKYIRSADNDATGAGAFAWARVYWQQVLGIALLIVIYLYVFLRRVER